MSTGAPGHCLVHRLVACSCFRFHLGSSRVLMASARMTFFEVDVWSPSPIWSNFVVGYVGSEFISHDRCPVVLTSNHSGRWRVSVTAIVKCQGCGFRPLLRAGGVSVFSGVFLAESYQKSAKFLRRAF